MRVDRNGSVLSLLLIRLPRQHGAPDVDFMARILEGRLRITDTPGHLNDGRIAVLLPDTTAEGAWKVATDVSEVYPPGPSRPECDVLIYPPADHHGRVGEKKVGVEGEAADELIAPEQQHTPRTSEFFFSTAMPLWKRAIDVVGGGAGLMLACPVIVAAATAIKLTSRGPVFFVQRREGRGGQIFRMWKLRTMHHDAEQRQEELLHLSHQDGPAFKLKADPRTTKLGRFLRWTSLDELPQLWNVLRGEMSLVGPRPLPVGESRACEPWQRRRLNVTPGMTCTWQIAGRGTVKFDDWVRMDLRYARRPKMGTDLKLIFMTLPSLLFHRGIR